MPVFRYKASDGAGNPVEGEIEAIGADAARESVWALGYVPFDVQAKGNGGGLAGLTFGGGMSGAQLASLTRDLAVLVDAGLPVDRALTILVAQSRQASRRTLATGLRDAVISGQALGDALERRPAVFAADYVAVVRAGEASGRLGPVLMDLASLLERREEVRARTRSALAYPLFVLAVAGVALGVIIGVLVPNIAPIFQDSGRDMPPVVAFLLGVRAWSGTIGVLSAAAVVLVLGLLLAGRNQPAVQLQAHAALLRIPFFGELARYRDASRYLATLATLVGARVPLVAAMETASGVLRNAHLRAGAEAATADVREGAMLVDAMGRRDVLPIAAMQMIGVGEETGRLADMLARGARLTEAQERTRTERFLSVLTPALTVMIASLVGAFIFAVVGALLDMNDAVLR